MADNPAPAGWELAQLVWQPKDATFRERADDERTAAGKEIVQTKFIVAAPIGVSSARPTNPCSNPR